MLSSIRPYLERTYRQRLSHLDDVEIKQRAQGLEWIYHDKASTEFFNITCGVYANEWHRAWCQSEKPMQAALLLSPTYIMKKLNWFGVWRPQPMAGACSQSFAPVFAADNTWVEVLRLGPDFQEGGLYGCWFLAAKGSGIFLNTGRSLRAENRSVLADLLGYNLTALGRKFLGWNPWRLEHNTRLCEHARQQGYDSLQIWWEGCAKWRSKTRASEACFHEIISCQPECLALPTPCQPPRQHSASCPKVFCPNCCRTCSANEREIYQRWNETHWPQGPCINSRMLRTGWDASLPCECDDTQRLLNCLGTGAALPEPLLPATEALTWKQDVRSPQLRLFFNQTPPCGPNALPPPRARRWRNLKL
jgi:hypothetical protein